MSALVAAQLGCNPAFVAQLTDNPVYALVVLLILSRLLATYRECG